MNASLETKQPKGMLTICLLQLLGMVGFMMFLALLVLYVTKQLHFSDKSAYAISGAFNALVFITSVPGGYIAERFLGYFKAAFISIIMCALGAFIVAIPSPLTLYIGLSLFIMGTGMMVPCLFVMLGHLYPEDHTRRETGFVLAYVSMNAGGFISSSISGSLSIHYSYSVAFLLGAVASVIMLPVLMHHRKYLKDSEPFSRSQQIGGIVLTIGATIGAGLIVKFAQVANSLMIIMGALALLYTVKLSFNHHGHARKKLWVFLLLTTMSIIFWTLYSLSPSLLTLFTERNIDRHVLGWLIPTANLSCLNPFFIVTMGPLMSLLWQKLKTSKGIDISTPAKFGWGLILMGVGYLVLSVGTQYANALGYVALAWLVLSYFFQTLGEIFVGPIGYAMVGELVPADQEGLMMGIWQLAAGIAGALSDWCAEFTQTNNHIIKPIATNPSYIHAFTLYGSITVLIGLIAFIITPKLKGLISGDNSDEDDATANLPLSLST
ncbi:MAG: peptide MFS transporter [Coxiellaceae bacterium]|nr:peptide MFS transporter [Coxiellaceae bacterium]